LSDDTIFGYFSPLLNDTLAVICVSLMDIRFQHGYNEREGDAEFFAVRFFFIFI
jgi:hypothetical protein